jgi:hypothetical protein
MGHVRQSLSRRPAGHQSKACGGWASWPAATPYSSQEPHPVPQPRPAPRVARFAETPRHEARLPSAQSAIGSRCEPCIGPSPVVSLSRRRRRHLLQHLRDQLLDGHPVIGAAHAQIAVVLEAVALGEHGLAVDECNEAVLGPVLPRRLLLHVLQLHVEARREQLFDEWLDATRVVIPPASVHVGRVLEGDDLGGCVATLVERVVYVLRRVGARHSSSLFPSTRCYSRAPEEGARKRARKSFRALAKTKHASPNQVKFNCGLAHPSPLGRPPAIATGARFAMGGAPPYYVHHNFGRNFGRKRSLLSPCILTNLLPLKRQRLLVVTCHKLSGRNCSSKFLKFARNLCSGSPDMYPHGTPYAQYAKRPGETPRRLTIALWAARALAQHDARARARFGSRAWRQLRT